MKSRPAQSPSEGALHALIQEALAHARDHQQIPTESRVAEKAGFKAETLSRMKSRGTCDFATLHGLVSACGLKIQLTPAAAPVAPGSISPGPAGWANPKLDDRTRILIVLQRARYQDILAVVGAFGIEKVMDVAQGIDLERRPVLSSVLKMLQEADRKIGQGLPVTS